MSVHFNKTKKNLFHYFSFYEHLNYHAQLSIYILYLRKGVGGAWLYFTLLFASM